jgi:hypothetical protein
VRPTTPRAAAAVVALVAVLLVAGCGSGVSATEWAGRVCAAVEPWRATIADLNAKTQRQMASATTPTETRDNLLALLTGGENASESARAAVVAAGVPDVDGGAEIAGRFAAALTRARDAYHHAGTDLAALPTADAASFYDGVVAVMARLGTEYAASGLDTSNVSSVKLRQAFDGVDQCR